MLGVPVVGPTTMYGDNMSVILNTTVPSSQLKKKHNAIAYHRVREAIAAKILTLQHIPSTANIADVLTKPLPVNTFYQLLEPVLFREQSPINNTDELPVVAATGEHTPPTDYNEVPKDTLRTDRGGPACPLRPPIQERAPGELTSTPAKPPYPTDVRETATDVRETATIASRALHVALLTTTL